jgi:hypothetical protein
LVFQRASPPHERFGAVHNAPPDLIVQYLPDQLQILRGQTCVAILLQIGAHVVEPLETSRVEAPQKTRHGHQFFSAGSPDASIAEDDQHAPCADMHRNHVSFLTFSLKDTGAAASPRAKD